MKLGFFIPLGKKKYKFSTVYDLEHFILNNKQLLKDSCIYFIDENKNIVGKMRISSYLKMSGNEKS